MTDISVARFVPSVAELSAVAGLVLTYIYLLCPPVLDITEVTLVRSQGSPLQLALTVSNRGRVEATDVYLVVRETDHGSRFGLPQHLRDISNNRKVSLKIYINHVRDLLPASRYDIILNYSQRMGWRKFSDPFASRRLIGIRQIPRTPQALTNRYQSIYGLAPLRENIELTKPLSLIEFL